MADLNVGSVPLGDHDRDWFVVMSKLGSRSIRANLSSVMGFYVRRRKKEYEEILRYTASKYGLTPSECFKRILNDEDLGDPVDSWQAIDPPSVPFDDG